MFKSIHNLYLVDIVNQFLLVAVVVGHVCQSEVHPLQILIIVETTRRGRLYPLSWLVDGRKSIPGSERQSSHSASSALYSDPLAVLSVVAVIQEVAVCQS